MTLDVGTTKRKPLTPRERLQLYELFKGVCVLCGRKIEAGEPWIDEHLRALGLGGTNAWDNRAPVHGKCAEVKTKADMAAITKAKAVKQRALGIKPAGAGKIRSAGFRKFAKPPRAGKARIDKSALGALPRRNPLTGNTY